MTPERLCEVLSYDQETGCLRWTVSRRAGNLAGYVDAGGYRQIKIDGRMYLAHRLAWLYVHRRWPVAEIDHMNGLRDDNRLANLREVTHSENLQNQRRARRDSKTGLLGTSPKGRKFQATIKLNGKARHLGYFDTAELAHEAYIDAKRRLHPAGTV